jgi:hypothetical protein
MSVIKHLFLVLVVIMKLIAYSISIFLACITWQH